MPHHHTLSGADGTALHVFETGNRRGIPLVLIHGWTQSHLCWRQQFESSLADEFRLIAPDLRGHGQSAKPAGLSHYATSRVWAEDLAAVLTSLELHQPVLVGWSYGSMVIGHYLTHYGDRALSAINFVGAGVRVAPAYIGTLLGRVFEEILPQVTAEDDLTANISGIRRFLRACFTAPISREDWETALAYNMVVPPGVRAALLAQAVDITPATAALTRPALVSHGLADEVVLPAMAELLLAHCPTARASWYEGVGHGPFLEAPARFNQELAALARTSA